MKKNARAMALRYRIWAFCNAREWNVTIKDISEGLGDVSIDSIRGVLQGQNWFGRVRSMTPREHAQGATVIRDSNDETRALIRATIGQYPYGGGT